jgi:hypothetical protein
MSEALNCNLVQGLTHRGVAMKLFGVDCQVINVDESS